MKHETQPRDKRGLALGASMYVPCTHPDVLAIANGEKLGHLRSVIFCLEDAVAERDLAAALRNLEGALEKMRPQDRTLRFVRARNVEVMARVLAMPGAEKLAGFVIPKATRANFASYFELARNTGHLFMPTLETAEVFDDNEMRAFREELSHPDVKGRILALRIGGNDLLALLGLRRPKTGTIYQTPVGLAIGRLVAIFKPHGFELSSPVFEHISQTELLDEEIRQDMAHGIMAKTAIHPDQVAQIERHYEVDPQDLEVAMMIVDPQSPAVFKMQGSMCEVATHASWAAGLIERARSFGAKAPAGVDAESDRCDRPRLHSVPALPHENQEQLGAMAG